MNDNSDEQKPKPIIDSRTFPQAHHYQIHTCGHCPHLHVIFFSEKDEAQYQAVLSVDQLARLTFEAIEYKAVFDDVQKEPKDPIQ